MEGASGFVLRELTEHAIVSADEQKQTAGFSSLTFATDRCEKSTTASSTSFATARRSFTIFRSPARGASEAAAAAAVIRTCLRQRGRRSGM